MVDTIEKARELPAPVRSLTRGLAALRILFGLVWLSNALAKAFKVGTVDWGFLSFNLINLDTAEAILTDAAGKTQILPLGAFYRDVVLPNWDTFGTLLTVSEIAIGVGLLFGAATRLAAVGGLLLIGPIWIMLWPSDSYLWSYPLELFPLLLLAIVPAGRTAGLDRILAPRLHGRWPF